MGQMIDLLRRLPAKSPEQLLNQLSALHDRLLNGELIELPKVTLMLSSGQCPQGVVLKCEQALDSDDKIILLQSASQDVLYLPQAAVVGITVHYSEANLYLLTTDSNYKLLQTDIFSRLELDRQAQKLTTALRNSDINCSIYLNWDLLPITVPSMKVLAQGLQDLETILLALHSETIGRIALATQVQSIELRAGTQTGMRLSKQIMILSFTRLGNDLVPWPIARLRQSIEQQL